MNERRRKEYESHTKGRRPLYLDSRIPYSFNISFCLALATPTPSDIEACAHLVHRLEGAIDFTEPCIWLVQVEAPISHEVIRFRCAVQDSKPWA